MDKKWTAIIILASSIPLIIILFSLISPKLSPTQAVLENCNTLEFNSNQATNIVFFSGKEQAEEYKNFFQETAPFDKYKKAFNFYYIDSYTPKCELYQGIAILCHNKETIKKGASCPNDYLIVLEEHPTNIRSSSYENVMSINTNHPLSVLTHEFGHAFANLAEEYTPAKIPKGSENCAQECSDFGYETDGCYEGCSESTYQRSIANGVMRTLSSNEYGKLNEALIIGKIRKNSPTTITGKAIQELCEEKSYYLIEGLYRNGAISILNKSIEHGCVGSNGAGTFTYELQTFQGTTLTESEFNPELIFTDAQGENEIEGETIISDRPFILKIQKIPQGEKLSISESERELANVRLTDIGARACEI